MRRSLGDALETGGAHEEKEMAAMASEPRPQMGTWKLNEAKSKVPAGMAKNTTIVCSADEVPHDESDGDGRPREEDQTAWRFTTRAKPGSNSPSQKRKRRPFLTGVFVNLLERAAV